MKAAGSSVSIGARLRPAVVLPLICTEVERADFIFPAVPQGVQDLRSLQLCLDLACRLCPVTSRSQSTGVRSP